MKKAELKYKSWMVTIMTDKEGSIDLPSVYDVRAHFDETCEKYVFQTEQHTSTSDKRLHLQCAVVSKIRQRQKTVLSGIADSLNHPAKYIRVDKMQGTWDQAMMYCSKQDSKAPDTETQFSSSVVMPYDFADVAFLDSAAKRYEWQNKILDEIFIEDPFRIKTPIHDREIIWITDEHGNSGKSKFIKWVCGRLPGFASKLPFGTANQIRSATVARGPQQLYVVDIPRTLGDDDSINDVLSALEEIKNGFCVSSFYGEYKQLLMSPPVIIIFSNMRCPVQKLSRDRWKCYNISQTKDLLYSFDNADYVTMGYSMVEEGLL